MPPIAIPAKGFQKKEEEKNSLMFFGLDFVSQFSFMVIYV